MVLMRTNERISVGGVVEGETSLGRIKGYNSEISRWDSVSTGLTPVQTAC